MFERTHRSPALVSALCGLAIASLTSGTSDRSHPQARRDPAADRFDAAALSDLRARYARARSALGALDGNVVDAYAPRFINTPQWLNIRDRVGYRPEHVYGPTRDVWYGWQATAERVDAAAALNRISALSVPVTRAMLAEWQRGLGKAVSGDSAFRSDAEVGISFNLRQAITREELAAIQEMKARRGSEPVARPLIDWVPTPCIHLWTATERTTAYLGSQFFAERAPVLADADAFFTASDGSKRQCGYYLYPAANEVPALVDAWIADYGAAFDHLRTAPAETDVLAIAARIQRGLVMIHPYADGNGRMSRFAMDYWLESAGLPAPVLEDMNLDFSSTESQWAATIGRGIERVVEIYETCARSRQDPGCRALPSLTTARRQGYR